MAGEKKGNLKTSPKGTRLEKKCPVCLLILKSGCSIINAELKKGEVKMNKIGHTVCMLTQKKGNKRNGEGDFIGLKNGEIAFVYTEYVGESGDDHDKAQITMIKSKDDGESWGEKEVIVPCDGASVNLMCVTLLRMGNGDIGLFYGRKYISENGDISMGMRLIRSSNEGKTWTEPMECIDKTGYFVSENARVIRLLSGRIIIPLNLHYSKGMQASLLGTTYYYISDDDGKTFYDSGNRIENPVKRDICGLQETGIVEMEKERLFSFSRTGCGSQFESFSEDGGLTWSYPEPSTVFFSPASPMHIRHIEGNKTAAVFNPIPSFPGIEKTGREWSRRTPLLVLICEGAGENFWNAEKRKAFFLEDDPDNAYSYPAVFSGKDYFLCAYYHSNNTDGVLASCKITKIFYSEIK